MKVKYDLYDANPTALADVKLADKLRFKLMTLIASRCNGEYCTTIKDCAGLSEPGVSFAILGLGTHFTFHSFSERRIAFVDMQGTDDFPQIEIIGLLHEAYQEKFLDMRRSMPLDESQHFCKQQLTTKFGTHLTFSSQCIDFKESLDVTLDTIKNIGMQPLVPPLLLTGQQMGTFSILQPITTSHVAIHCDGNKMLVDIFSCQPFVLHEALGAFKDPRDLKLTERGIELPTTHSTSVAEVSAMVE